MRPGIAGILAFYRRGFELLQNHKLQQICSKKDEEHIQGEIREFNAELEEQHREFDKFEWEATSEEELIDLRQKFYLITKEVKPNFSEFAIAMDKDFASITNVQMDNFLKEKLFAGNLDLLLLEFIKISRPHNTESLQSLRDKLYRKIGYMYPIEKPLLVVRLDQGWFNDFLDMKCTFSNQMYDIGIIPKTTNEDDSFKVLYKAKDDEYKRIEGETITAPEIIDFSNEYKEETFFPLTSQSLIGIKTDTEIALDEALINQDFLDIHIPCRSINSDEIIPIKEGAPF